MSFSDIGKLVEELSDLSEVKVKKLGQALCPGVQQLGSVELILQHWLKTDPAPTWKKLEEALLQTEQIEAEKKS